MQTVIGVSISEQARVCIAHAVCVLYVWSVDRPTHFRNFLSYDCEKSLTVFKSFVHFLHCTPLVNVAAIGC